MFAGTIGRRGQKKQRKQPLSETARPQRQPSEAGRGAGGAAPLSASPPSRDRARFGPLVGPPGAPRRTEPPPDELHRPHRQTHRENGPPAPPPDGWRPMEAADALCPDAGGALPARRRGARGGPAGTCTAERAGEPQPGIPPRCLAYAAADGRARGRPDLHLTGRDLSTRWRPHPGDGGCAPRRVRTDNGDDAIYRRWVHIDFRYGHAPADTISRTSTRDCSTRSAALG